MKVRFEGDGSKGYDFTLRYENGDQIMHAQTATISLCEKHGVSGHLVMRQDDGSLTVVPFDTVSFGVVDA